MKLWKIVGSRGDTTQIISDFNKISVLLTVTNYGPNAVELKSGGTTVAKNLEASCSFTVLTGSPVEITLRGDQGPGAAFGSYEIEVP